MIKKHKNKNDYWMEQGVFVRDLTKENVMPLDINDLNQEKDYSLFLENENTNHFKKYVVLDHETISHSKIIIISDGFEFDEVHKQLYKFKKDITIIAVNGALKKWKLVGKNCPEAEKRAIGYYVVNNPYVECMWFLPREHSYYPKCIASTRTNHNFLSKYQGLKYVYNSVQDKKYSGVSSNGYRHFDDYRNPICAALSLAYSFNAKKIALLSCDEVYQDEKPGMIKSENNLYCYPQQIKSNLFIDGMCYWLNKENIKIVHNSIGIKLNNSEYINIDNLIDFFEE